MGLQVHLVDGTYELFRYHYSPANKDERDEVPPAASSGRA